MTRRRAVFVLVILLATAGCVNVGSPPLSDGDERPATVTRVVDGDTVEVRFGDAGTDTVRLLGVDAPEADGRNDPTEFEGVPDTEDGRRCLGGAAHRATTFVERHLAGASVRVVVDGRADRRDRYDRLLAYVVLENGTNLNYRLVESGHARVYDSTFSQSDRFYAAESTAQRDERGLWACRNPDVTDGPTASPLRVATVRADAAGNDRHNLNDEYVVFRNEGEESLDLSRWTVSDAAGHVYPFPQGFVLGPDATVTLHTGPGTDSADSLYWGSDRPVWNNDGDRVVVTNASGSVVLRYGY